MKQMQLNKMIIQHKTVKKWKTNTMELKKMLWKAWVGINRGKSQGSVVVEGANVQNETLKAWENGVDFEIEFWKNWIETKGAQWKTDFAGRMDPEAPLQDFIKDILLSNCISDDIKILDVGSGPLTYVGKQWDDKNITIVAIDPLADKYLYLLEEARIEPPVKPIKCSGEEIMQRFSENEFDFVISTNALDHSYDPLLGIRGMLKVVKPGGTILIRVRVNEGEYADYGGFHQWNFDVYKGRVIIWNRSKISFLEEVVENAATTQFKIEDFKNDRSRLEIRLAKNG